MNKKKTRNPAATLTALSCAALAGCASAPSPPEVYAGTQSSTLMYPLIDSRTDGGLDIDKCETARPIADTRVFISSKSDLRFAVDQNLVSDITRADLDQRNAARLRQIPTAGDDYVVFLFLDEFSMKFASFKFRLTAYVVRPETGDVAWTRRHEDSIWQGVVGGPLNKLMDTIQMGSSSMSYCAALNWVTRETFAGMPMLPAF